MKRVVSWGIPLETLKPIRTVNICVFCSTSTNIFTMGPTVEAYPELSKYRWSSSNVSAQFDVINPATGAAITRIAGGTVQEVDAAVKAAHAAYQNDWRWRTLQERGALLLRCGDLLEEHADEIAAIESLENGKPFTQARQFDVRMLCGVFRYFGSLVDKLPGEFYDQGSVYASVIWEPYGVVGAILPFNWIHTGGKIAPALAAGNTVVIKPGEQAPLTVLRIVELINTILPNDVVQIVPAFGPEVPSALVEHPLVRKVSFTGSTAAGKAVSKTAAPGIIPLSLELGGKNAFVVFEDADIDLAAKGCLDGGFFNQGEACTASSRVLVHRSIHNQFVSRLVTGVRKLIVGNGADEATHVGPLVTQAQQKRVLDYLKIAAEEGATMAAEAKLPTDPALANGFFVAPTLLTGVTRNMRVAKEEIFGPVVTVTAFDTHEEAIDIVNESEYGLVAGVYSKDSDKCLKASREIDAGIVFVNNYWRQLLGTPFGGAKHSGYGREHSIETLREYSRTKTIRVPSGMGPVISWGADLFE